jgi:hypothetical protein
MVLLKKGGTVSTIEQRLHNIGARSNGRSESYVASRTGWTSKYLVLISPRSAFHHAGTSIKLPGELTGGTVPGI